MPTYILLSTLTPEGRQTLHRNPERLEEVNREITEFGCKVVAQYAVLGPGSDIHVMLVKRFRVTVDQQRLPRGRRSTEIYGHPRGLSPVQVSRV